MSIKFNRKHAPAASLLTATIMLTLGTSGFAVADENTGTTQQGLVGGTLVPAATQEQYGLLTLANPEGTCSASMLNDYWAITAAHCVYSQKTGAIFTASQINLTANWPSNTKTVQAMQVVAYSNGGAAAYDIALLQTGLHDFTRSELPGWPSQTDRMLDSNRALGNSTVTAYGRGINALATQSGSTATPTQLDGQYRSANFNIGGVPADGTSYSYSGANGATIAGGDSGGPSLIAEWDDPNSINRKIVMRLLGVHSRCSTTCLAGQSCAAPNTWQWVSAISSCTDAAVYPLQATITQTIQQIPPPREFIGTFGTTSVGAQQTILYSVQENGNLLWYRQNAGTAPWQGPKVVGWGWQSLQDIIPAGGNHFYGLTSDGSLLWYEHDGFNDGTFSWKGPVQVGWGWTGFVKIFAGSDGILYAIKPDGTLVWYRHDGFQTGAFAWEGPRVIGSGWADFKDIFSMGQGIIYAVRKDGTLVWYKHAGYATGDFNWSGPYTVGSGWQGFSKLVPAGSGIIYGALPDGTLLRYQHVNYQQGTAPVWTGGTQVGSGWNGSLQLFAILPSTPVAPH